VAGVVTDDAAERELIDRAARGDGAAFEALIRSHAPAVVSLAAAELGDRRRADEVAQDVFVRLHRSLATFRHESRLRTWLVRVTLNACADERRRARRDQRLMSIDDAGPGRSIGDRLAAGDETAEARELKRAEWARVREAIAALPGELRILVSLRYDAGLEYRAIARELSLPPGTVATRMARALRQLRAGLADTSPRGTT
jgi:RNA polymerase sigma-70 factor (ECF subfamily)